MNISITYSPSSLDDLLATLDALDARGIAPSVALPATRQAAPSGAKGKAGWGPNVTAYCNARGERRFSRTRDERALGLDNETAAAQRMMIDGWQGEAIEGAEMDDDNDNGGTLPPPIEHDGSPLF